MSKRWEMVVRDSRGCAHRARVKTETTSPQVFVHTEELREDLRDAKVGRVHPCLLAAGVGAAGAELGADVVAA